VIASPGSVLQAGAVAELAVAAVVEHCEQVVAVLDDEAARVAGGRRCVAAATVSARTQRIAVVNALAVVVVGEPGEDLAVAGVGWAPAAERLPGELVDVGEQLRLGAQPSFVALDDLLAGAVAADFERVAPFRGRPTYAS
jgi:hypothetical protein